MYVYRGLQCWSAELQAPLDADELVPLLPANRLSQLAGVLGSGGQTYLTFHAPGLGCEIVKATYAYGVLTLERGQDGTAARPWPKGSCLEWTLTGQAVKEIVQETIFCEPECQAASIVAGGMLPNGSAGVSWTHVVQLGGTPPFTVGQFSVPAWMTASVDGGEIRLSGTPPAAGAYDVTVQIKNCGEARDFFRGCVYVDSGAPPEEPA
jgi:hypothetical protein